MCNSDPSRLRDERRRFVRGALWGFAFTFPFWLVVFWLAFRS